MRFISIFKSTDCILFCLLMPIIALLIFSNKSFADTYVSGTISGSSTWNLGGSPYIVEGNVSVRDGGNLTIEGGVVVKFQGSKCLSIAYNGHLNIEATSGNSVYFTSFRDDTLGGDSNGDGNSTSPATGDWGYIYIDNNDGVDFHDCIVRYGGYASGNRGAIRINECSPTVQNCVIEYCVYGIETFGDSHVSTYFNPARPAIRNNQISYCKYSPLLQIEYAFPVYSGNVFTNNGYQTVSVHGVIQSSTALTELWNDFHETGLPYLVDSYVTLDSNVTLQIPGGTIIKFSGSDYFRINSTGGLDLRSTSGSPVYFTSFRDDTLGGDSNGDGNSTSPATGDWGYIYIDNNDGVDFHDCIVRYGGYASGNRGAIRINECSPTVQNCVIEYCVYGIETFGDSHVSTYFNPARPAIRNNQISYCKYSPLLQIEYAFPVYSGNVFTNNGYQTVSVHGVIQSSTALTELWNDFHETGLPYLVDSYVTLDSNVTLQIPGGTIIKFSGSDYFRINSTGGLDLRSTSGSPVYFTSFRDDTLGGDSNGDGNSTSPAAGDWGYIYIDNNDGVDFHDCIVRYGGYASGNRGAIRINECSPTVQNCVVEYCVYGIETFGDSNVSTYFNPARPAIRNNQISYCKYSPLLQIEYAFPVYSGNVFTNNGYQTVSVHGVIQSSTALTELWNDFHETGLPYLVDSYVTLDSNVTLQIPGGTIIKFSGSDYFRINSTGGLDLRSTSGSPVYFTSFRDDTLGGDSNGDGNSTSPAAGDWGYIYIDNNDGVDFHDCIVRYGGYASGNRGAIRINECSPTVQNCVVEYCVYGIETSGTASVTAVPAIKSNKIRFNKYGIYVKKYSCPTVLFNEIHDNYDYAIYNDGTCVVKAFYNDWGNSEGPAADQLFGSVDYASWVGEPIPKNEVNGTSNCSPFSADPVNTATGNYIYENDDLFIKGIGINFLFKRSYNSQSGENGPLGYGWTHKYNYLLSIDGNGVATVQYGDGHFKEFQPDGESGFISPPDSFDTLENSGDGTYTLSTADNLDYLFNGSGKLTSITDPNGNSIAFSYDGTGDLNTITDTMGRVINITNDASHRITQLEDPIGRTISFAYDADGDLVQFTDTWENFEEYTYDAQHQILTVTDKRGNTSISLSYDGNRVVTSQKDAYGYATSYSYNTENRVTTIADAENQVFYQYYDANFRLIKEVDPLGNYAEYTYDAKGNRTSVRDKKGNVTTYACDDRGNVLTRTDPLGYSIKAEYNSLNLPTRKIDQSNNETTLSYDENGNLLQIRDALGYTTTYTYNTRGQKLTQTNARNYTSQYAYDASGYLQSVTNPEYEATSYTYDGVGRLKTVTDPRTHTTSYTYNPNDNLKETKNAYNETITNDYDPNGNLVSVTNALNQTFRNEYDFKNRLVKMTNPKGEFTQYVYDKLDRKTKEIVPIGNETLFEYDVIGNLKKITDPNNNVTQYEYDANGRKTKTIDARSNQTLYEYDADGHLVKVTDAENGITAAECDKRGNLTKVTDAKLEVTQYVHDELNRLIKEIDPLLTETIYTYDPVGNFATMKDANGQTTTYTYDKANRLTNKAYSGGGSVGYGYDASGNRTAMVDSVGTTSYVFDFIDRVTQVTSPYGKIVQFRYDAAGRKDQITYPGDKHVVYEYDDAGRLRFVRDWLGTVTEFVYDAAGLLKTQTNGNGTTVAYAYDESGRLTSLVNKKSDATVISSHEFVLDAVGNRKDVSEKLPLAPTYANQNVSFAHNDGHQVTSNGTRTFTYDGNGNRITATGGGVTTNYTYNAMDRLTRVADGTNTDIYTYNGDGDRIASSRNGSETRYVLNTSGSMPHVLADMDSSATSLRCYIYANGLLYSIDTGDNSRHYYHYDAVGSTLALTDQAQEITDKYAYNAYGSNLGSEGSSYNPFRYIGQFGVTLEDNGLNYMRVRFYDPVTKGFMGKDPVKGTLFEPLRLPPVHLR